MAVDFSVQYSIVQKEMLMTVVARNLYKNVYVNLILLYTVRNVKILYIDQIAMADSGDNNKRIYFKREIKHTGNFLQNTLTGFMHEHMSVLYNYLLYSYITILSQS